MKSELFLKENPRLVDFQEYVSKLVQERGFQDEKPAEMFMLLSEEIGEMAKAMRKSTGIKYDKKSHQPELDLEIADVFIYLLDICNYFKIDLETAFRKKEEINKQRKWTI
jgi:NTP pyrophosphatase (non-canonical NTP hydrolase)